MKKKVLIQFTLILTIFLACFIFYQLFLTDRVVKLEDIKNVESNESKNKNVSKKDTNQINDIVYNSEYLDGNNYIIKAEFGMFDKDNPDLMILTNVKGTMFFKNSDTIEISSKKARYNSVNNNTSFYQNVSVIFDDHQINSDNFDLFFDKKIGTIYNNIIYKNLNTVLQADKIDIDLITKNSKIYMLDKSKKVKIKYLN
jgi:hypothetical protein